MKPNASIAPIFERQWLHVLALAIALPVLWMMSSFCGCFSRGEFLEVSTWNWFWISVEIPIAHQLFVWFCWRTELHRGLISRFFGRSGFALYSVAFVGLLGARLAAITALSVASRNTLPLDPGILRTVAVVLVFPVSYLGYSVVRHFGILRAFGADHFDETFRSRPLVRKGIFRFTANGMYTFGMMVLYIPALWYASRPALVAAVFAHLYIWVHYYTTELPDMRRIYGTHTTA